MRDELAEVILKILQANGFRMKYDDFAEELDSRAFSAMDHLIEIGRLSYDGDVMELIED